MAVSCMAMKIRSGFRECVSRHLPASRNWAVNSKQDFGKASTREGSNDRSRNGGHSSDVERLI